MKQNLNVDMQNIWALLSPKSLRLPECWVEMMNPHKKNAAVSSFSSSET